MASMHKIGKTATTIRTENGETVVTYHSTDVVRFSTETITLNTGGWRTVTTKARMNQASNTFGLDYYVSQRKGDWFVDYRGQELPYDDRTITLKR